jgi:hypothetical protein
MFRWQHMRATLLRALLAAVASHRADLLRRLVDEQGERCVAGALSRCSARVLDDALSMMQRDRRAAVMRHLPRRAARGRPLFN